MDVPVCEVRALLLSTTILPALRGLQFYAQLQHGVTMHVHPCKNRPCAMSQAEQWGAGVRTRGRVGVKGSLHRPTIRTGSCTRGACITIHPGTRTAWESSASPQGPDWCEHTVHQV